MVGGISREVSVVYAVGTDVTGLLRHCDCHQRKKKKKKNFDIGTLVIDPARLTDRYMAEEEQTQ